MEYLIRHLIIVLVTIVACLLAFMAALGWYGHWYKAFSGYDQTVSQGGSCNIAVIPLGGTILSLDDPNSSQYGGVNGPSVSGDTFVHDVHNAENDPNILGILVPIDSGGGDPAASSIMMNALARSSIPSVALIRSMGASGAYMAALGASRIIASQFADVGSIGVTYSYLSTYKKDQQEGITYEQLSSGPFKDTGSPDKPLTDQERALFQRDIKIYKDLFVGLVASMRHLPTSTVETLADGSTWPAQLALQNGLVDEMGDDETARAWFAQKLGMDPQDIVFCGQ